ncbi:MAG: HD domain-containing protein [Lachnospiraceae bacterium]|nr:HD domain-containing protein [Lachnospiraceae bacterium]
MKVITVLELKPGMELGESVTSGGNELYAKGTKLDEKNIDRIKRHGVMTVTIMEPSDYASTHHEKLFFNERYQNFVRVYNENLVKFKGIFISYTQNAYSLNAYSVSIFPDDLIKIYNDVAACISSEGELLDFLYNMVPNEDEMTYTQSFNAALLAGAFANWLKFPEEEKRIMILCGFYYDIGKWTLPNDILWKPGKLTDEEFALVKKHPSIGYSIIKNDSNLNEHVKNAVMMHHEKYDGSGYPFHMVGDKIDKYARYMSIVDTYIAMASPRSFRNAFTPLQILATFESSMDKYDVEILLPLMKKIADAQIGSRVVLSDDSEWEVIMINTPYYSRPILKSDLGDILDLKTRPDLSITKLI